MLNWRHLISSPSLFQVLELFLSYNRTKNAKSQVSWVSTLLLKL